MACEKRKNITIIGGTRGLGKWITEQLKKEDLNITITSRNKSSGEKVANKLNVNYTDNNIESVKNADIIIFSVPIEHMVKTIKEVAPHAPEGSVLMDITSVKTEPSKALVEYAPKNVEVLPCHPMFGPRVPSLEGQVVILTPLENQSKTWFSIIENFLQENNVKIVITTPEEHDKTMSVVQGLTHFSYISIASTIRKLNISVKKSREFASPVYSLMLDMISRIVSQNPYLYYSIQKSNKETTISRKQLIEESIYLANLIENDKEDEFVKNMGDSAKHLDEYEEALGRSDKAISILTHDLNVLKESVGKEVGLEHQYSKNVHVGIVKRVTHDKVFLKTNDNKMVTLNISNVNILSESELYDWKRNNLKIEYYDVSALFPRDSSQEFLIKMFVNIEPVIDVELIDVYTGEQIKEGYVSYTFHYSTFNKGDNKYVEEYLRGIGATIR